MTQILKFFTFICYLNFFGSKMVNTNTIHFLQLLCGVKLNTMIFAKQKKKLSERKKHINAQLILRSNTLKPSLRKMFVCFIPND